LNASVIIPVRNGAATLRRQLDALAAQSFEGSWQVLVSDNGSTDSTASIVDGYKRLPILTVDSSARPGISSARNCAAAVAEGDVLLFCDSDDVVGEGWIAEMSEALTRFDVVGGRLDLEILNDPATRSWRSHVAITELPVAFDRMPYAVGANLGVRRTVFDELGGFDESFRTCGDDVDFCWRAQINGNSIGFAERAVVHYQLRSSLVAAAKQQYAYGRVEAMLRRQFAGAGVPERRDRPRAEIVRYLATRSPNLVRGRARRGRWVSIAAYEIGRVVGSRTIT
jgi:glycosyltransferase involved in cell wall biosynthesis